jgi:hypothetical protein
MLRGGRRSVAEIIKKPDDNAIRVKYEWRCHRVFASFSQIRRAVVLDATQDSFLLAAAPR